MSLLLTGVLLFALVHLVPSLAPGVKAGWRGKLGEGGYKGSFSLLLLAAFALIIMGWRSALPASVYVPPASLRIPGISLAEIAFLLMVVSSRPSRLKQVIRHPQLTGVLLWALGHLMINGDSRSVVLFSAMALWAVVEMVAINRREGAWIKGEIPPWRTEFITLAITVAVVVLVVYIHPWIAGMPVT